MCNHLADGVVPDVGPPASRFIAPLVAGTAMASEPFEIDVSSDATPGEVLLVGLSHLGMAGLTAADYLVRKLRTEEIGHVSAEELPAITPFEDGTPRHHTRLYTHTDSDVSVLVGELFVPVWAARSFVDALLEWVDAHGIEEIVLLHGVPFQHGPEEHAVHYVAAEPYRRERLADVELPPLKGGLLDGVPGELVERNLQGQAPPVGVYVTPTHPPGPDFEAAIAFLEAVERVYGVAVDGKELAKRSEEFKQYYADLADRIETLEEEGSRTGARDYPEDRMYM